MFLACALSFLMVFGALGPSLAEPARSTPTPGPSHTALSTQRIADHFDGKIGVLRSKTGAPRCTAFCLSKKLIATAGHCLRAQPVDTNSQHTSLIFEKSARTPRGGQISSDSNSSQISGLVSGGTRVSFRAPIEADRDWAILRLQKPICTRGGLKLVSRSRSHNWSPQAGNLFAPQLVINKQGAAILATRTCNLHGLNRTKNAANVRADFSSPNSLMFHNCDAGPIASGSPIVTETPYGLEVIAMHVGTYVRSRVLEHKSTIVDRIASKPIANIAVPVAEFVRPVKDLLDAQTTSKLTRQN